MNIAERALEFIPDHGVIGLGSGRAAEMFVNALAERVRAGALHIRGVATSVRTAQLAKQLGIPLLDLGEAGTLDVTVDGADEVDPDLNLIKGYGRAMVREKVVAASSRNLIILVGQEKLVPKLGSRGKLPVEVTPFALTMCEKRLHEMGLEPVADRRNGSLFLTDNGNHILDCKIGPIADPKQLEIDIRAVPGVVGTGLFLGMANVVLIGREPTFEIVQELQRPGWHPPAHACKYSDRVPPVVSEWQTVLCPNCAHYYRGDCVNPNRAASEAPCPFDGQRLPLREATAEDV